MGFIKNFDNLATSDQRKIVLELIESAFDSIQPDKVINSQVKLTQDLLKIQDKVFDLKNFDKVYILGFGKGSAGICQRLEEVLGDKLLQGFDIDVVDSP